jgi:hypothetical protein
MVVYLLTLTQVVIIGFFQVFIKTETYNDQQQVQVALVSFVVSIIFSAILKAYCSFHMGKTLGLLADDTIPDFIKRTFADWAITEIRTQIRVLIGLLLFIIPGLIEALRLSLAMPFVFYDKRMDDKTFDPVFESRELLHLKNPILVHLFGLIILAPIMLFLAFQNGSAPFFEDSASMLRSAIAALAFALFTSYTYLYFAFLYKNTVLKNRDLNDTKIDDNDTGEI